MKDFSELGISAIIMFAQFIWFLFKLAVGYVILVGCFTSLGVESPLLSYAGQYAEVLISKGGSYPFAKMAGLVASFKGGKEIFIMQNSIFEKWVGLLFLVLFVWFIQLRKKINLLESHIEQMKLCNVTLLNYLRIEPLTDGLVKIREKGPVRHAMDSFVENLFLKMFGLKEMADDTLTAVAIRGEKEVSILDDINKNHKNSPDNL